MWMWRGLHDQIERIWPKKGSPQPRPPQIRDDTSGPESSISKSNKDSRRRLACYCCTKRFTRFEQLGQFLGLGQKCPICDNMVCKGCITNHRCHTCIVRGKVCLEPADLLALEARELIVLLKTIHCEDPSFITWPKPYLVKQLLVVLKENEDWDPAHLLRGVDEPVTGQGNHMIEANRESPEGRLPLNESTRLPGQFKGQSANGFCNNGQECDESIDCIDIIRMRERKALENIQGDLSDIPNEDLCKICMESRADIILINCGHMVSCTYCSELIKQCPICRLAITDKIRASTLE